jgi:tetratricopeptide (TPR) repeat protein
MRRAGRSIACFASAPDVATSSADARPNPLRCFAALAVLSALAGLCNPASGQWSGGDAGAGFRNPASRHPLANGPGRTRNAQQPTNVPSDGDLIPARRKLAGALAAAVIHKGMTLAELSAALGTLMGLSAMTPADIDAAMGYKPDPQVSAKVRAEAIDGMTAGNPVSRQTLENAFGNNTVLQEFERLVTAHGYSSHNIADAIAAELWTAWQDVHDVRLTDAQIRGIHQQVRVAVRAIPELRSTSNVVRQRIVEAMAYLVVVRGVAMQDASDPARLAAQRQAAASSAKTLIGVDLWELGVTADSGFSRKQAGAAISTAALEQAGAAAAAATSAAIAAALNGGAGQSFAPDADLAECRDNNKDFKRRADACKRAVQNDPAVKAAQEKLNAAMTAVVNAAVGQPSVAAALSPPARPAAAPSVQSSQPPPELAECVNRDSKDVPRWLDACTRAIETNPGNKDVLVLAYLTRASVYTKLRQFDRVIADSDEVLRLAPQGPVSSIAYGLRGVASMQQHEHDRALADFDKSITSQPSLALAEAYAGRGSVYLKIADYQRARADLDKAISLKPGFSMAYAIRAQYRLEQNDNAGAFADANEGLQRDPQNADCYAVRAEYYVRMGRFTEAQADADQALGISPGSAGAHAIRGRVALAQDRIEVALGELTEAIDLESQEPDAIANRGIAYERSGRADRAIADYRRALQLMPASKMGREALENARQRIVALANAPAVPAVPVPAAPPGRRIALVIGMSAYANVGQLRNPGSDARSIADAFRRLGFADVIEREDLTRAKLEEALKEFGDKAADADWAVIYYAGHGVERNGVNYLVPVDAKLARAEHVEDEAVTLTRVLSKTEAAHKLRMVILDACRNNPFRMTSAEGRSRAIGRGLSPVEPARGVLVAYAARDGTTADDGDSGHSPFTQALLANLETPGVDIRIMFSKVRDQVLARTNNAQEPFTYGSLPGQNFYFKVAAP